MKHIGIMIIVFAMLLSLAVPALADRDIPAVPEIQGISTATSMQTQGTVTESDSLAWTTTSNDSTQLPISPGPPLADQQVQYTTGYNAQYSGVSGQTTFAKAMAIGTGNKIADQSNVAAATSIQFIAIDTGRATNAEDLLLDGVSNSTNGANAILCPFGAPSPSVIPAYCNIVQAGSAFDSTLTSTVTAANDRFVGTDSGVPIVLNYNVASKGITLSDGTSSPMIGSASAYLKLHVQEARNESVGTIIIPPDSTDGAILTVPANPIKSEDIVYSETSTASGLITGFAKSMSYSSQASAVPFSIPAPITIPSID